MPPLSKSYVGRVQSSNLRWNLAIAGCKTAGSDQSHQGPPLQSSRGRNDVARILIVDDEPQFRRVLRVALSTRGHDVREATSGTDALAILHTDPAQLILLDWQMPGLDGLQTCRAIRECLNVPIIIVTAYDQNGRDQALAAGADDYVTKPFQLDYLMARVENALGK